MHDVQYVAESTCKLPFGRNFQELVVCPVGASLCESDLSRLRRLGHSLSSRLIDFDGVMSSESA